VLFAFTQPVDGLQLSSVHTLLSLQLGAAPPTHEPPEQTSPVVHALPSLQASVLFVCVQPVAGLQLSVVQGLLSLQLSGVPAPQEPPLQTSWPLQTLLSSHAAVLLVWVQPLAGSHESFVQELLSLQLTVVPPPHVPFAWQVSPVVHALPSLHGPVPTGFEQTPVVGLQVPAT